MWGLIEDIADTVWDAATGLLSELWNIVTWVLWRFIGLFEFGLALMGIFLWRKNLRVAVIILIDPSTNKPVASREEVSAAFELAREVFSDQVKVDLIPSHGSDNLIVSLYPEPAPEFVMEVPCEPGFLAQIYTDVGQWFRRHSKGSILNVIFGVGKVVTVYVVRNVISKRGCMLPPFLGDYGYIDPTAVGAVDSEGVRLTLAHELGHACDLLHKNRTLMQRGALNPQQRVRTLRRWQKAVLRTSPRVTYW